MKQTKIALVDKECPEGQQIFQIDGFSYACKCDNRFEYEGYLLKPSRNYYNFYLPSPAIINDKKKIAILVVKKIQVNVFEITGNKILEWDNSDGVYRILEFKFIDGAWDADNYEITEQENPEGEVCLSFI